MRVPFSACSADSQEEDANVCQKTANSCVGPMLCPEDITDSDEIIIGTPEGDNMSVPI